jgi:hypothetical protein
MGINWRQIDEKKTLYEHQQVTHARTRHTHFSKNIKSHYPSLYIFMSCWAVISHRRRRVASSNLNTHTHTHKKNNFASLIASFSFFFQALKKNWLRKEWKSIFIYYGGGQTSPFLLSDLYTSVFFFPYFASAAILIWFDLFSYSSSSLHSAVPRGFSRAHRTKSDHSGFSRAGGSNDFQSSHHGIFPPLFLFLLIFWLFIYFLFFFIWRRFHSILGPPFLGNERIRRKTGKKGSGEQHSSSFR